MFRNVIGYNISLFKLNKFISRLLTKDILNITLLTSTIWLKLKFKIYSPSNVQVVNMYFSVAIYFKITFGKL